MQHVVPSLRLAVMNATTGELASTTAILDSLVPELFITCNMQEKCLGEVSQPTILRVLYVANNEYNT